jgi:hypothetical protein
MLFGDGYRRPEESGDALPVIVGIDTARFFRRQILPVVLQLEARVSGAASRRSTQISPNGDYRPVIGNDLDACLGGLLDVAEDTLQPAIALGALPQIDLVRVHADGFEDYAMLVAIVLHPLQLVAAPGAVRSAAFHLRREMFHTVAEVVLQVCFGCDVGAGASGHAVIVAADMDHRVLPGSARDL